MQSALENPVQGLKTPAATITEDVSIDALLARMEDVPDTPTATERPTDAASLRQQQNSLNEELKSAMLEGNAGAVIRIQNLLRDIPARLVAFDVSEIKTGIDNVTERLAEVEQEISYVQEIRKTNNRVLADRILEAEAAQTEVRKNDFAIEVLKMEQTSLHEARRDYRLRLAQIIDDAEASLGGK